MQTGGKMPKGADAADTKGERHEMLRGGVAMGKEDAIGKDGEFNTGRTAGVCYEHQRADILPKISSNASNKNENPNSEGLLGLSNQIVIGELNGCKRE